MELWFEAVPSVAEADAGTVNANLAPLARIRAAGASRILVPEVVDTGYESIDAIAYAARAAQTAGLPAGVAIVTSTRDHGGVASRIQEAEAAGVDAMVLVGPPSRDAPRPGPSVNEALAIHSPDQHLGVVTIPTRHRPELTEAARILAKQRAGARFAVSQIVFEAERALAVRREYVAGLKLGEAAIPFYYALAPVCRQKDVLFLRSLGVDIPKETAAQLLATPLEERAAASRQISVAVARQLMATHEREKLGPLGFCISHVMFPNIEEAIHLLEAVAHATGVLVPIAT